MLPKTYFKKSKCKRSQMTLINASFMTDHSEKGWTNNQTFGRYLTYLRKECFPIKGNIFNSRENRIYLIADTYPVHISASSIRKCQDLNIDPITIPEGCTDILQPLDHRLFGVMKSKQRSYLEERMAGLLFKDFDCENCKFLSPIEVPNQISKKEAASLFQLIWDEITEFSILEAFEETIKQYFPLLDDNLIFSEDEDFELRLSLHAKEIQQEQEIRQIKEKTQEMPKKNYNITKQTYSKELENIEKCLGKINCSY